MPASPLLLLLLLLLLLDGAAAYSSYQRALPNGNSNGGMMGHGRDARSSFGADFGREGRSWTTALCEKDSDGDGLSNGAELGDPCCDWSRGGTPAFTTGLSHPGKASSKTSSHTTCSKPPPPPPKVAKPAISVDDILTPGVANAPRRITMATTTSGATICYRKGGRTPACSIAGACATESIAYTGTAIEELAPASDVVYKAVACRSGFTESAVTSTAEFTVNPFKVAASAISETLVNAPLSVGDKMVTMSVNTPGSTAVICYTNDGSTVPAVTSSCVCGTDSKKYTTPVRIATSTIFNYIACAPYYDNSDVGTKVVAVTPVATATAVFVTSGNGAAYKGQVATIKIKGTGFSMGDKVALFRSADTCGSLSSMEQSAATSVNTTSTALNVSTVSTNLFGDYKVCVCQKKRTGDCDSEDRFNLSPGTLTWQGVGDVSQDNAPIADQSSIVTVTGYGFAAEDKWKLWASNETCGGSSPTADSSSEGMWSVNEAKTTLSKQVKVSTAGSYIVCICDASMSSGCASNDKYTLKADGQVYWFDANAARLESVVLHGDVKNIDTNIDMSLIGADFDKGNDKIILINGSSTCGQVGPASAISVNNSPLTVNGVSPKNVSSNSTYLNFQNIKASAAGAYKVCFCDKDTVGGVDCDAKEDYKTEASSVQKTISWLAKAQATTVDFMPTPVKDAANPSNAGTLMLNGANLVNGDDTVGIFPGETSCNSPSGLPALMFSASECNFDGAGNTKLVCPFQSTHSSLVPGIYTACLCDKSQSGDCSTQNKFNTQPSTTRTFSMPALMAGGAKLWWEKDADTSTWNTHFSVNTTNLQPNADRVRFIKWDSNTICGVSAEATDVILDISDCSAAESNENKLMCLGIQIPAGDWRVCMCDSSANHNCTQATHYTIASPTKVVVPQIMPTRAIASSTWLVAGTTVLQSVSIWGKNFDPRHDKLGLIKITNENKAAPCDGLQSLEKANIPCNLKEGEWGVERVDCGPILPVSDAGTFAMCMCDGNSKAPVAACGSEKGRYKTLVPGANVTYVAAATVASIKKIAGKANAGLRAMYEISGENLDPMRDRIVAIQESESCGSNTSTVQGIAPGSLREWSEMICNAGPAFIDTSSSRQLRRLNYWNSDSSGVDWSSDSSRADWSADARNGKILQCPIVLSEGKAKFCVCDYSVHGSCAKLEYYSVEPTSGKMLVETGPGNELLAPGFDTGESNFKVLKSPDGKDRFGMAWNFIEDWLYVGVRAETKGYISVAFGETLLMKGADAVVGWIDDAGVGQVKSYKLRASDNSDPGGDMSNTAKGSTFINTSSVSREGKFMTLTFRRKVLSNDESRRRSLSAEADDVHVSNREEETNILWAVSSEAFSANRLPSHSPNDRGAVAINLASGAVKEVSVTAKWISLYVLGSGLLVVALSGILLVRVAAVRQSPMGYACLQKTIGSGKSCRFGSKLPSIIYQDLNPVNWFLTLGIGEFMAFVVVIGASVGAYIIDTGSTEAYLSPLRSTGKLVGTFAVLTVLSITRSFSLFLMVFGIPFERAVKWHRGLAKIFVLLTFVHFLCHAVPQGITATLDVAVFGGAEAVPLFGTLSFLAELLIIITSLEAVRRNYFEVFYFLHYACFLSMMAFSILHVQTFKSPSQLVFVIGMGAAIFLWLIDLLVRFTCAAPKVESCVAMEVAGITKLTVKFAKPRKIGPGDYFFLALPDISKSQVHPFSVSSQPAADQITFHIKQMGEVPSFTGKLRSLVKQRAGSGQTSLKNVSLSGPYGRFSVRLEDYDTVWLIAGGIGITPMISTALHLESILTNGSFTNYPNLKKVHLVWSVRSVDELSWFDEELVRLSKAQSDYKFQLHLYVTRYSKMKRNDSMNVAYNADSGIEMTGIMAGGSNPMNSSQGIQHEFERDKRPSYASLFEKSVGGRVAVMACGPPPLVANAESCAFAKGFHFHKETFLF